MNTQSKTGTLMISHDSTQLGLKNIKQRLRLLNGKNTSFAIDELNGEVVYTIKIPLPLSFYKASRQQIINTKYIKNVVPWFNGKLKRSINNGQEVEVSRRASYIFTDRMGL